MDTEAPGGRRAQYHEDGWFDLVVGAGALADGVGRLYEAHVDGAPEEGGSVEDERLLDLLMGIEVLAARVRAIVAACEADTDPADPVTPTPLPRGALR